jgi:hypothetical protein
MENQQNLSNPKGSRLRERLILWMIIFLLVLSNVLTVANNSFQQSIYEVLSHIPVESFLKNSLINNNKVLESEKQSLQKQVHQMNTKLESHRIKSKDVSGGIVKRLKNNAKRNLSSFFGESIPYIGTALIVAVTVADIKDACDTIIDINDLARSLETETNIEDENIVCGLKIPNLDDSIIR